MISEFYRSKLTNAAARLIAAPGCRGLQEYQFESILKNADRRGACGRKAWGTSPSAVYGWMQVWRPSGPVYPTSSEKPRAEYEYRRGLRTKASGNPAWRHCRIL